MKDLFFGVQSFDTIDLLEILGGRRLEFGDTIVGIKPVFGFPCFVGQHLDNPGIGRAVWLPYSHIDDGNVGMISHGLFFCPLYLFKLVDSGRFSELLPAQPLGDDDIHA